MEKILIVNLGRKGSGPVYSLEMVKALEQLGTYRIKALISRQCENFEAWQKSGIDLITIDTFESNKEFVLNTLDISRFVRLIKEIKKYSPDYLYIPMIHLWNPIVNLMAKGAKIITTIHDITQHKGEESFIMDSLRKIVLKQSHKIIILSESLREKLVYQKVKSEDIFVIPHANFTYYGENFDIEKKNYNNGRILFFGRINAYKGLDVLLEAMKIVVKENSNIKLSIVGNGDIKPYEEQIKELGANIESNVRWIKDEEVEGFFMKSDFVVVPYIEASQSGVIPLSYSFGLPVIASRIGGIPEQVVDGETGYLLEPNNVVDLAEMILDLSSSELKRKELGKNAYIFAKEKLSWEGSAKLFDKLVKSI